MKKKKGKLKWIIIVIVVIGIIGSSPSNKDEEATIKEGNTSVTETINTEESIAEEHAPKTEEEVDTNNISTELDTSENVIELVAGEQGQYGKLITMSAGTDMEESFYAYYIPSGTYEVINKGEYMTQISVYEGFTKNEETGYDEYTSTGNIVLLDVGKTDIIEIPDGWFIEIQEPAYISLTLSSGK